MRSRSDLVSDGILRQPVLHFSGNLRLKREAGDESVYCLAMAVMV